MYDLYTHIENVVKNWGSYFLGKMKKEKYITFFSNFLVIISFTFSDFELVCVWKTKCAHCTYTIQVGIFRWRNKEWVIVVWLRMVLRMVGIFCRGVYEGCITLNVFLSNGVRALCFLFILFCVCFGYMSDYRWNK